MDASSYSLKPFIKAKRVYRYALTAKRLIMIHEFRTPIAVKTPHGDGDALLFIDYGLNVNSVWVVRLHGGEVKHYYSDQIQIYGNPMDERGWDIKHDGL